jgi:hypothetical protein
VRTAVINKRAGGMGLISGRKAFQRSPMAEGVKLLNAIQDVYLRHILKDGTPAVAPQSVLRIARAGAGHR